MPIQALGTPTGSPLRRILVLVALVALVGYATLQASTANADTVQGTPTSGCVTRATLWAGSATTVHIVNVTAKIVMNADPTVVYGVFTLGNGAQAGGAYISSTSGQSTTTMYNTWSAVLQPGGSGTLSFQILVPGYASGSCASVSEVRVTRSYYDGAATPPPGGTGGFASPAAPTAAPTAPPGGTTLTPVPGGPTPGPGTQCWIGPTGTQDCYPNPPAGWCYSIDAAGTGSVSLVPCTVGPTFGPPPGPDFTLTCTSSGNWGAGSCNSAASANLAVVGEHFRIVWSWTVSGPYHAGSGSSWLRVAEGNSGSVAYVADTPGAPTFGTGCTLSGVGARPVSGSGTMADCAITGYSQPHSQGYFLTVSGEFDCCGGGPYSVTVTAQFYRTAAGAGGATPQPTTGAGPVMPTQPPNYWGGGTMPPIDVNVNIGNVNICADGGITACARSFPPSVDLCVQHPDISACVAATAVPTYGPFGNPGSGGGINGSPAPNGVAECAAESHPPKPGILPLDTFRPPPSPPANPFDWVVQGVGGGISNAVTSGTNVAKGAINTGIDFVVPGPCVGTVITSFADDVGGRVPFSWFNEVQAGLTAGAAGGVTLGTVSIGGASVNLANPIAGAADAVAPYRSILGLLPWLLGALAIMRKVMGTVGAGEGGG